MTYSIEIFGNSALADIGQQLSPSTGVIIPLNKKQNISFYGGNISVFSTFYNNTLVLNVSSNANFVKSNTPLVLNGIPLTLGFHGGYYALMLYNINSTPNNSNYTIWNGNTFNLSVAGMDNVLPVNSIYSNTKPVNSLYLAGTPLALDSNNTLIVNFVTGTTQEFGHVVIGGVPIRTVRIGYNWYLCVSVIS